MDTHLHLNSVSQVQKLKVASGKEGLHSFNFYFYFLKKFFLKESFPCDDSLKLHYASK